jgi:hypothetical protein|tara:strand:- start:89 stop:235 length:147 start_codon:yes stop_codon:yes gene_type:complete
MIKGSRDSVLLVISPYFGLRRDQFPAVYPFVDSVPSDSAVVIERQETI